MKRRLLVVLLCLLPLALAGCSLDNFMKGLANQPPNAVIDALPTEGHAPLTVQFDGHYSHDDGTIIEYHWNFGDPHDSAPMGGTATTHTYTYPGVYLVQLTVTDDKGEMNWEKVAIVVTNPPPVASFSISNDLPPVGEAVIFDASASYDPYGGEVVDYSWDFGDGNTGTSVETNHSYTEEGYYVVTLTVTDNEGEIGTERRAVIVQQQQSGGGCSGGSCGGGDKPLAVITGIPGCAGGKVGVPITFDGSASRAAEGTIIRYKWDFGDGETTMGMQVSHAYQKTGRFVLTLTVTDDGGKQATATGVVSIGASCY